MVVRELVVVEINEHSHITLSLFVAHEDGANVRVRQDVHGDGASVGNLSLRKIVSVTEKQKLGRRRQTTWSS
jgi:hypothetical protein